MDGNTLRVSLPTADDSQRLMPWADPRESRVLALPPADIYRWRLSDDIVFPKAVGLHTDWVQDLRYQALRRLVMEKGQWSLLTIWSGIAMVALELIRNTKAVGLGLAGFPLADQPARTWWLEDSSGVHAAVGFALRPEVGMLLMVDPLDTEVVKQYQPAPDRSGSKARRAAQVRSRDAQVRSRDCAAVDVDVDVEKEREKETDVDAGGKRRIEGGAAPPAPTHARTHARTDSSTVSSTHATAGLTLRDGTTISRTEPAKATAALLDWLYCLQQAQRTVRWPDTAEQLSDFQKVVRFACQVERERPAARCMEILVDTLRQVAKWATESGGYYAKLIKGGYLPKGDRSQ